jgi:hypothetical protein
MKLFKAKVWSVVDIGLLKLRGDEETGLALKIAG